MMLSEFIIMILLTFSSGRKNWGLSQPPLSPKKAPLDNILIMVMVMVCYHHLIVVNDGDDGDSTPDQDYADVLSTKPSAIMLSLTAVS